MTQHPDESELLAEALSGIMHPSGQPGTKKPFRLKKSLKVGFALTVFVTVILGSFAIFSLTRDQDPFNQQLQAKRADVSYVLYSPTALPRGYSATEGATINTDDIIFTTLKSSDTTQPAIIISQQPIPSGASIQSLLGLVPPKALDTPSGKLYLASTETHVTGVLVTSKSWIIMTSEKSLSTDVLEELGRSFKPIN